MIDREITYKHGNVTLKGKLYSIDSTPRPAVLVAHAWGGRKEFEVNKAKELAKLGYVGFALDMFGDAKTAESKEECSGLITPFMEDRTLLLARLSAAVETLQSQDEVESSNIAAIGYCFGGLCVLDLARSGSDIKGVVSFHGLLNPPAETKKISAKVLALHGYDDPMADPQALTAFAQEMSAAGADWQVHAYGNTKHAFTNPKANDPDFGTVYDAKADSRSWASMQHFLTEILND